ncbi:SPOR domain-containing protein [Rhodovulum marinum]|uniref:Sporulation related protein n=1 Tax=Rhodovulum marinum TaxID=320662 RepID=A0A4R2PYW2_9RHOB|nr:SPOR domain-containing protein [Rhodovulum marinum]TCP41297.1 sporulation related protein [Rhodovulum marinum]
MKVRAWLCAGLLMAGLGAGVAAAQDAVTDGPAELPPQGFSGSQYVDSRGCVFMRAGVDGRVAWVPRLSRDRSALCGYQPTVAPATGAVPVKAAAAVAPSARPVRAVATPARRAAAARGGTGVHRALPPQDPLKPVAIRIPRGYRAIWTDGRLNELRGPRTAQGDAQMAQVWTDTVPRRQVAARAPRFLRVGIFHDAGAAQPTVRRLRALGLPASRAEGRRGARPVEVIYAGPFADAEDLARAETRLQRAGFRDLVPRK